MSRSASAAWLVWRMLPFDGWPWPLPVVAAGSSTCRSLGVVAARWSAYLLIAASFEVNINELFAGQGIEGYKSFLRLHIAPDGALTLYPIGVDRVARAGGPGCRVVVPPGEAIAGADGGRADRSSHRSARADRPLPDPLPLTALVLLLVRLAGPAHRRLRAHLREPSASSRITTESLGTECPTTRPRPPACRPARRSPARWP